MTPIFQLLVLLLLTVSVTANGYWSNLIAPLEAFNEVDISESERLIVLNDKTKKRKKQSVQTDLANNSAYEALFISITHYDNLKWLIKVRRHLWIMSFLI
jgi:hypothetical protein